MVHDMNRLLAQDGCNIELEVGLGPGLSTTRMSSFILYGYDI